MKSQSSFKTLVIPASQSRPVAITGTSFYLEAATGAVDLQFDEGTTLRCKPGQTVDLPPGDFFRQIIFTNPDTSATLTVQYYAGTVAVGTRTPYVFVKPAPKYTKGATYAVTTAADSQLINSNTRTGKTIADTLAYMTVSNRSAGDYVLVKNAASEVVLAVPPLTAYNLETTDACKLRMEAGAGANISIGYFFNYDS